MMRSLFLAAAIVAVGCDSSSCRCHSGYYVTSYHEAYTQSGETCTTVTVGEVTVGVRQRQQVCIPFARYHPARCTTDLSCIVDCATWDKGSREAHPKHGVYLGPPVVDPRCNANGSAEAHPKHGVHLGPAVAYPRCNAVVHRGLCDWEVR